MEKVLNNISIIVAVAKNFAIGKDNDLLFYLPNDLKRFKQITTGYPVIMGRNTLLSLPKWPLPNRTNIVITDKDETFEGCVVVNSIEAAVEAVKDEKEAFVMGGGMIYRQFFERAKKLYLTYVDKEFDADTFFPEIDFKEWDEEYREDHEDEKNKFKYSYLNLVRK
ncbi:dihydrofolate reductase [Prolixibacteraceae bacterium JC049]|nr:dihydrofolate reductase [Prolixibacteraceae bacterium JC049]